MICKCNKDFGGVSAGYSYEYDFLYQDVCTKILVKIITNEKDYYITIQDFNECFIDLRKLRKEKLKRLKLL